MIKQQTILTTNPDFFTPQYSGYINIYGDSIYKSDIYQNELLVPNNYFETFIYSSPFYTDWVCDEAKKLPYQLDDILLQPNELVHAHVLNASFNKLFTNIEYILSRNIFYTNTIPTEYVGWFGCGLNMVYDEEKYNGAMYWVDNTYKFHDPSKPCYQYFSCKYASMSGFTSESNFSESLSTTWIHSSNTPQFSSLYGIGSEMGIEAVSTFSNQTYSVYDNIIDSINFVTKEGIKYTIFATSSAITFQQFTETNNTYSLIEDETMRITEVNGIKFKNITSVSLSDTGYLYVYDSEYNSIYQFDLHYIINSDSVIHNIPLLNVIGGGDKIEANIYKFDNIKFIKCSGNYLFIYDDHEFNILIFDQFLNYVGDIGNSGFSIHNPVSITHRKLQNDYYILCEDGMIFVTSTSFKIIETYQLNDSNKNDYKAIASSLNDSNVYYIVLYDTILQKLYSNNKTVGVFNLSQLQITYSADMWWRSTHISWIDCEHLWGGTYNFPSFVTKFDIKALTVTNVDNIDELWLFANNGRLLYMKNDITQISLMERSPRLLYNKHDLQCEEQEYVQSMTYNKIIKKFLDILNVIASHTLYYPQYTYDYTGNLIFDKLLYNTSKLDTNKLLNDLKIYDNDILTTDIINRVLTGLFTLEQQLLNSTQIIKTNTKYQKFNSITIEI